METFLADYYFQTYYREPIHPVFASLAAQFQSNARVMSDDAFAQFLGECRQCAADFEKMVDDTRFGTELDVEHGQIIGKNSDFQNDDVHAAFEKGYTRNALEVLSGYEANVASACGYWLAEKCGDLRGRKGVGDLIDLYLSGQVVALLRGLRKDYVVKAFRYGYSNKSISEATQMEGDGLNEETVKGYTEDKTLVNDFCIGGVLHNCRFRYDRSR